MLISCKNNVTDGYVTATVQQVTQWPIVGLELVTTGAEVFVEFPLQFRVAQGEGITWDAVSIKAESNGWEQAIGSFTNSEIQGPEEGIFTTPAVPAQSSTGRYDVKIIGRNGINDVDETFVFIIDASIQNAVATCSDYDVDLSHPTPVVFEVTMSQGSSVTVDIDFGDGSDHDTQYTGDLM